MKNLLILLWFGLMTMGIQSQNKEGGKTNEGRIPARFQTSKMQNLQEVRVQPRNSISDFLMNEIEYPKHSIDFLEEGQVVVEFTIETDGHIRDLKVINSVSPLLDDQVITCLQKTSGLWIPAYNEGEAQESVRKLYVTFDIIGNPPLNERSVTHFSDGIKHIQKARHNETDVSLSLKRKIRKMNRHYKRALLQLDEARKLQAEESAICYWQSYAYLQMGDLMKMQEKLEQFKSILHLYDTTSDDFITINAR